MTDHPPIDYEALAVSVNSTSIVLNEEVIFSTDYSSFISFDGDINLLAQSLFKTGQKWKDRSTLFHAVNSFAAIAGFSVFLSQEYIKCNRFGIVKKRKKQNTTDNELQNHRAFASGQLKAGCTFSIQMASTVRIKSMPKVVTEKSKPKYRNNFNDNVIIIIKNACCTHAGLCKPSCQQQLVTRARGGSYIKNMNDMALFTLCNVMKHNNGILKTETIKSIVSPIWPSNKNITKSDVFNIRIRVERMLPKIVTCYSFESFQKSVNSSDLITGLDNITLNDDEVNKYATNLWSSFMNEGNLTESEALLTLKNI
jgi:hypothetical protein